MEPTPKHPQIADFLEKNFGRTTAITQDKCVPAPVGCGKPIEGFRSDLSEKEYRISGLCQNCQDEIFGVSEEFTVSKTQDEFGEDRYFVTDSQGNWLGDPFPTHEAAIEEIASLRNSDD